MRNLASQLLANTIHQGSVYLLIENTHIVKKPHYFVILNKDPWDAEILLLVNATSKIEKRRQVIKKLGFPESTLVKVSAGSYSFLSLDSAFDCNSPIKYSAGGLLDKLEFSLFKHVGDLPIDIVTKIIEGVINSPQVDEETKDLLR